MRILHWLRALNHFNFYNWNKPTNDYCLTLDDLSMHDEFHLGRSFEITSVNRTTGRVTFK